jgi:hypothetical protein
LIGGIGASSFKYSLEQCDVICDATLKLRACGSYVRSFYLLYEDANSWLDDHQLLSNQTDYLEVYTIPPNKAARQTAQSDP